MVWKGTYEDIRALCNEASRGLGLVAFFSVLAFLIYNLIFDGISLGWLWLPTFVISVIFATLAIGIPVFCLRIGMEIRRPTISLMWFSTLKIAMVIWTLASFVIAWHVAKMVTNWMS